MTPTELSRHLTRARARLSRAISRIFIRPFCAPLFHRGYLRYGRRVNELEPRSFPFYPAHSFTVKINGRRVVGSCVHTARGPSSREPESPVETGLAQALRKNVLHGARVCPGTYARVARAACCCCSQACCRRCCCCYCRCVRRHTYLSHLSRA